MYQPKPIDTANIELPSEISNLTEKLAASTHDVWAVGKMAKGYSFGETTNDAMLTHADLIPYLNLSEEKKDYDRNTAMETLKAIYALGYEIRPREHQLPHQEREEKHRQNPDKEYHPIG